MVVLNRKNTRNIISLLSYILQKDDFFYDFKKENYSFLRDYYSNSSLGEKEKVMLLKIDKKLNDSIIHSREKVTLTIAEADLIRNFCSDILELIGFDENYKLNDEGKIFENLIDILYTN